MGLRIATNTQAIAAQRHLGIESAGQKLAMERLSSGSRINRAADDAAGLAVSERMRSYIRSMGVDVRNANDGISLTQVAEGGMNEIGNILVRFRELSIQAASDTITDTERGFVDKEVQQLKAEVDRIAGTTEFNGKKLLNGESGVLDFQIGLYGDQLSRITYNGAQTNVTAEKLGVSGLSVATKEGAQTGLEAIDGAIKSLVENRATLGALQNRLSASTNHLQIYQENLSKSRSQITDTDFAIETAELTKQNILTQAGISVLSQANQNNAMALKLLS
jgi:flagellin